MSDKTMHVLAYMILAFFVWLAINPYQKVDWRKAGVWLIIAVIVWYGVFDEWLQSRTGRMMSMWDLAADLVGILSALILLSIFSFWPALLVICGMTVFSLTNLSQIDNKPNLAWLNMLNNFCGYAIFTLIWIQYISHLRSDRKLRILRWSVGMAAPGLLLLVVVRAYGVFVEEKSLQPIENYAAILSIAAAVAVSAAVLRWSLKRTCPAKTADTTDRRSEASATN